jgi:hypothetical protein
MVAPYSTEIATVNAGSVQMRQFKPKLGTIVGAFVLPLLSLIMAAAGAIVTIISPMPGHVALFRLMAIGGVLLLGVFGAGWLAAAVGMWCEIDVDQDGITRRSACYVQRLLWRDLATFEIAGLQQNEFRLGDSQGRQVEVDTGPVPDGGELAGILQDRVAHLRDGMIRDWRTSGVTLHARMPLGRTMPIAIGALAVLCAIGVWLTPHVPIHGSGQRAAMLAGTLFCALCALTLGWAAVETATRTLWLTANGVAVGSLLGRTEVAFSDIASMSSQGSDIKGATISTTTVRSRGNRKVLITSHFPHYADVVAFVKERAGQLVDENGAGATSDAETKQYWVATAILGVLWPIVTFLFIGLPIMRTPVQSLLRKEGFFLFMGAICSIGLLVGLVQVYMKAAGIWVDPPPPVGTWLDEGRLRAIRRELNWIAIGRGAGIRLATGSIAFMMAAGLLFCLVGLFVPAIGAAGRANHLTAWSVALLYIPAFIGFGGMAILAPLGEVYAYLRCKALAPELGDPRLAPDLVTALERFSSMDRTLSGAAALRLTNGLATILRRGEPVDLSPAQRLFLYACLAKWQNVPKRAPVCIGLLEAIPDWGDAAGFSAARTAALTSNSREVREAATRCLGMK